MGWKRRGQNRYFYLRRGENGRVVTDYFGRGEVAELAASVMEEAQKQQAIRVGVSKFRHNLLQAASQAWFDLNLECQRRMEQTLGTVGYRRVNHGPCRCRAQASLPRPPRAETVEESRWFG
jgi:hypothetical protein